MKKVILIIFISITSILIAFGQCSVTSQIQQGDCNTSCQGIANAVGTGVSPLSYFWSNGDIGVTADSLCANNTYYLTMTDSAGCMAYDTLIFPPAIVAVSHFVNNASCSSCCDGTDTLTGIPSFAPPCNSNITYQWFPLDTFGDTIPYRTNLCAQTYTVVISNLCDGCVYTSSVTVGYNMPTSLVNNESPLPLDVILYPNPSSGKFNIEWKEAEKRDILIELTNLTGVIVFSEKLKSGNGIKNLDLNICNGIYFVHLTNLYTNENIVKRIIIQN